MFIILGIILALISGASVFFVLANAEPQPVGVVDRQQIFASLVWYTPTPPIPPSTSVPSPTPKTSCLPRSAIIDAPTKMNLSESSTLEFRYEEGGITPCEVHARLIAAAFEKDPSNEEIVLDAQPKEIATWKWVISPKKTGSQVLLVQASGPDIPARIYSEFKIEVVGTLGMAVTQEQTLEFLGRIAAAIVIIIGLIYTGIQIYDRVKKKTPISDGKS